MIATLVALVALGSGVEPVKMADLPDFKASVNHMAKLRAIRSLIPEMAGPSAAKIVVDPLVGELKVTLRVTDRSLGWVLDQIADVLDLEWRKADGKLRLSMPDAVKSEIAKARKQRDQDNFKEIRRQYLEIAEKTEVPYAAAMSSLESVRAEVENLLKNRPTGWSERLRLANERWSRYQTAATESNQVLGFCVRQFGVLFDRAVRERKLFLATTVKLPDALLVDARLRDQLRVPKETDSKNVEYLFAAYSTGSHLYFTSHSWSDSGSMWADLGHGLWSRFRSPNLSQSKGWGQSCEAIATRLPNVPFSAREPLQIRPNLTSSDVFLHGAEAMGIDLVADAFHDRWRLDVTFPATISGFWSELAGETTGFQVKIRDNAVLARHENYWESRDDEIPESKVNALSASVCEGKASLDTLAAFVSGLTEPQRSALSLQPPFRESEDLEGVSTSVDVLQFWHSLQPEEKERALRHEVVLFETLNPAAKDAYRHLVLRGLATDFAGLTYTSGEPVLALLSGQTGNLALLVEPVRYRAATMEIDQVKVTVPIEEAAAGTKIDRVWDSLLFRFGTSAKDAILRTLDIPIKAPKEF